MIPVSVRQTIKGKLIEDPVELQKLLELDSVGNLMINSKWLFTEEEKKALNPGRQLVLLLLNLGLNRIDAKTLSEILERLGFRFMCGESPLVFPNDDISDLTPIHRRLRGWIDKGWVMETNLSEVSSQDFYEKIVNRELQEVEERVRSSIKGVQAFVKEITQ